MPRAAQTRSLSAGGCAKVGLLPVDEAANGLFVRLPALSARGGLWTWQAAVLAAMAGLLIGSGVTAPAAMATVLAVVGTLLFMPVVLLRLLALAGPLTRRSDQVGRRSWQYDAPLPVYTILVPLFREQRVVGDLVRALRRLDYPADKLDIKIILEAVDAATIAAVRRLELGPPFEVIVVPDRQPRTKPKALNYALRAARGELLTIYDAEDIPDPAQLKAALRAFLAGPIGLACVQARLAIDNGRDNWLAGLFAAEYLALFAALLPTIERLRLPMPLGGTSNHFRTDALRAVGGWDAYNVTEDADLGVRLARAGYHCATIDSCTYEEAPNRAGSWLKQRTRWQKGWLQTWFVHMRRPLVLLRDLGLWRWIGFQIVIGGMIASALVYPITIAIVSWQAVAQGLMPLSRVLEMPMIWQAAWLNLLAGTASAVLLVQFTAVRHRSWRSVLLAPLMPAYWLLVSLAAYRALWQLMRDPYLWEKTEHGLARQRVR